MQDLMLNVCMRHKVRAKKKTLSGKQKLAQDMKMTVSSGCVFEFVKQVWMLLALHCCHYFVSLSNEIVPLILNDWT